MGARLLNDGSIQPICNDCGIALCWGLSEEEYDDRKQFWDDWCCRSCRQGSRRDQRVTREGETQT